MAAKAGTLARTYQFFVNPDGSADLIRVPVHGTQIVGGGGLVTGSAQYSQPASGGLVASFTAGWTTANVGTAVQNDLTAAPVTAANSDTNIGTGVP